MPPRRLTNVYPEVTGGIHSWRSDIRYWATATVFLGASLLPLTAPNPPALIEYLTKSQTARVAAHPRHEGRSVLVFQKGRICAPQELSALCHQPQSPF